MVYGMPEPCFDIPHDVPHIAAQQRLSAGNLDDARLQRLHIAPVVSRLQIARLVAGATVIAMLAISSYTRPSPQTRGRWGGRLAS